MTFFAFMLLFAGAIFAYTLNVRAAKQIRSGGAQLHSLTSFHGNYAFLMVVIPTFVFLIAWLALQGTVIDFLMKQSLPDGVLDGLHSGAIQLIMAEISSLAGGRVFGTPEDWKLAAADRLVAMRVTAQWLMLALTFAIIALSIYRARSSVSADFRARQGSESIVHGLMVFCSIVAIFVTVGIVFSLVFETFRFFQMVPWYEFVFGTVWEPQIPIRADQIAGVGAFGLIPVFLGTLVITVIAMFIAIPVGLASAVFLNEFATPGFRKVVKPILEVLAGVPTVVYGFFAVLTIAPALRVFGETWGLPIAPNTALAAGIVMGFMLVPFISSFTDDALSAVPRSLRDGALALGATRGETMMNVLFPAAIPGIVGGILLAVSRAIGETMIVVMAAGLIAKMTINPFDSVTTVTVQIVTLLIGDSSFDNPKTLSAFALGMVLFLVTLIINIFAIRIVRKYREIYD